MAAAQLAMPSARACFSARAESPRLLANGVPRVGSCHGPFSALPSAPCLARQRSGSAVNRLQDSHREGLPSRARPGRASRTVAASAAVGGEPATTVSFAADGSSKVRLGPTSPPIARRIRPRSATLREIHSTTTRGGRPVSSAARKFAVPAAFASVPMPLWKARARRSGHFLGASRSLRSCLVVLL